MIADKNDKNLLLKVFNKITKNKLTQSVLNKNEVMNMVIIN